MQELPKGFIEGTQRRATAQADRAAPITEREGEYSPRRPEGHDQASTRRNRAELAPGAVGMWRSLRAARQEATVRRRTEPVR